MFTSQELHEARYYHAQHYLEQLRIANAFYHSGGRYGGRSLEKIEQDWPQIEQAQTWAARSLEDRQVARLCCLFPAAGTDLLVWRQSVSDQIRWLEPALIAARQLGDSRAECDHLCELGRACWSAGEANTALDDLQHALALAESIAYQPGIARAHFCLCEIATHQARYDAARQHAEVCLERYADLGDRKAYADALLALGLVDSSGSHYAAANQRYQQSLMTYREFGHREGEATALARLGHIAGSQRDFALARRYFSESHTIYRQLGHQTGIGSTLNMLGTIAVCCGDFPTARQHYEEGLEVYTKIGHQYGIAESQQKLGEIHQYTGRFEESVECYQKALAIHRNMDNRSQIASLLMCLGNVMLNQNKLAEARQWFSQAIEISRDIDRKTVLATSLKGLGQVAVHLEKHYLKAQRFFEEALTEAQAGNDLWVVADTLDELGQLALKTGNASLAKQRLLDALDTACGINVTSLVLNHLASFAEYWVAVEEPTQALELAHFVCDHPAALECTVENMQALIARFETGSSSGTATQAERAGTQNLDAVVKALREKLDN